MLFIHLKIIEFKFNQIAVIISILTASTQTSHWFFYLETFYNTFFKVLSSVFEFINFAV